MSRPDDNMSNIQFFSGQTIRFDYTNWRGETSVRSARVVSLEYGSTEWHKDKQWLLRAFDVDRKEERLFALRDMRPICTSISDS